MGLLFKKYKTKFRYALKPVFAMLVAKKKELPSDEWLQFTNRLHEKITANPIEYLGSDLPEKDLIRDILDELFLEFHKDLKLKSKNG
jgi:hypothetical protein